jgi:D-threo-aldose 1-dehydrogenase
MSKSSSLPSLPSRSLGRGMDVSILGHGTAPLGELYSRLDEGQAIDTIVAALDGGITLIDSSPYYGHGLAEHRVGAALRRFKGKKPIISTKIGRVMEPFNPEGKGSKFVGGTPHAARFDYSYDGAMRSLEQSALRMGIDRIDVVLIHDVDIWTHGEADFERYFKEAMNGAYKALVALRDAGTIGAIGVGINEAHICERFARAGDFDTMLMAGRYSLLEQPGLESFMPLAVEKGIRLMLGGVFNSGILATGPVPGAKYNYTDAPPEIMARVTKIEAVCTRHGTSIFRAALHFPLAHPAVASLVLGAVTPAEVKAQLEALSNQPPVALWAELKADGLIDLTVPTP